MRAGTYLCHGVPASQSRSSDEVSSFGPRVQVRWGGDVRTAERANTYQGIAPGQVGLIIDSYGMLAICLGKRSAAEELAMPVGTEVALSVPSDAEPSTESVPVRLATRTDA